MLRHTAPTTPRWMPSTPCRHGASQGFLVSAIFGVVAVIAAVALINVRKSDTAQLSEPALVAA